MTRREKFDGALWAVFLVVSFALAAFYLWGCAALPDPKVAALTISAEECWRDGDMRIQSSATCQQAVGSLKELVEQHPECTKVFGEGGSVRLTCEGLK